ncbi:hypothetical protein [Novosphingobium sp.]|uniref:hypothetical protein n=1 Tax=Novosphingobium sp. TaxID=1874826 RepID=UPI0028ADD67E|nr:hypothetical protein [Novosphingobium sp.]
MSRLAQTAPALAATPGFDWNSYAAEQCAARDQHTARLDAAEARNARFGAMLDNIAAGLIAGMDEGTS